MNYSTQASFSCKIHVKGTKDAKLFVGHTFRILSTLFLFAFHTLTCVAYYPSSASAFVFMILQLNLLFYRTFLILFPISNKLHLISFWLIGHRGPLNHFCTWTGFLLSVVSRIVMKLRVADLILIKKCPHKIWRRRRNPSSLSSSQRKCQWMTLYVRLVSSLWKLDFLCFVIYLKHDQPPVRNTRNKIRMGA